MHMIRFNNSGQQVWEQQVTYLTGTRGGYDAGARFVWWYQHHGRLAFDGTNYAAYFGVAITVQNGSCVDIHEGNRMQVISASGSLLSGLDSFDVGCSHSWTTRIVWDGRTGHYMMACATDNACRIGRRAGPQLPGVQGLRRRQRRLPSRREQQHLDPDRPSAAPDQLTS